ncbi:hypothetical protein SAMN05421805_1011769 [Saccharopolyspora antimicrobica]|uniref:Uncharacterized protein n=1 Tax=Saccharopolyspora antimicrobica TaxID=455193 RepID=A0A1I4U8F4_9PSEU|nr:hypothetical protein [Saccharopolyspora antimicrobica]RKT88728.1 hypothetical protein ATL45_7167 [Saccharopolyspora antimicrobica]SFM85111.1 hypothetical protein SAMN05421805_1011769 [Saccharopolyspora antimicrobica]
MVPADQGGGVMRADLLSAPVEGLDEALAAVDAFDRALTGGLLRPDAADMAEFARSVAATPLAEKVAEAADKAVAGAAGEEHFTALAAARLALLGSVHDALAARIAEATGRAGEDESDWEASESQSPNLLAAARSWLGDVARAGWRGIDHDLISGSAQIISAMLPDPALRRSAALLDGFAAELAASCPGASLERIPARRWADLWSRGMLLALPGAAATPATGTATGRLLPLGIDVQEHATAVQAQVHAVFEPADGSASRLVRASASVSKPDTVVGAGLWQLLRPHMSLLAAVGEGRSMELTEMPVTAEGDLIWNDEHAKPGEPADPFATARVALQAATVPATAPLDRHPARIAVPVFVEGYTARTDDDALMFTIAEHDLAVDTDRVPAASPLTAEAIAASNACIGLLRWDAGNFHLQPLAVETTKRKKAVAVHAGAWAGGTTDKAGAKAEKAATDAAKVLRERAGRLLRK